MKRILEIRVASLFLASLCMSLITPLSKSAAREFSFIRDTEIENTIRVYTYPIFEAAGLTASAVKIHLLNDPVLNAFVAGGQNIFINTGLLMRADDAGQVIGVLAHETGHITGGHLARIQNELKNSTARTIIAMVLGGLAAVASGQADAAVGVLAGSATLGQRSLLNYTRSMEQNADQAAVDYLETAGLSSKGLLQFLGILAEQESLVVEYQDPYVRSHPLTQDRIKFMENHVANSALSKLPTPENLQILHDRMRAKLKGFLNPPNRTLTEYKSGDQSFSAKYARAIAFKKLHKIDEAVEIVEGLIQDSPEDPFLHELKGDILQDGGRIRESVIPYRKAVQLLPWAALIRTSLAKSLLELNDPAADVEAGENLAEALRYEREAPGIWRLAATAYDRNGDRGNVMLALAEAAMLQGQYSEAVVRAARASELLPNGSGGWIRAQDIQNAGEEILRKKAEQ